MSKSNPRDIAGAGRARQGPPGAISPEQQFYYLRLMAKPGRRREPIKIKFPRWPSPEREPAKQSEERLEDQAMAVVRTVGQAFELCNRLSVEQNRERQLLEEERAVDSTLAAGTSGTRQKGSIGPESGEKELVERRTDRDRDKSSSSPAQNSPRTGQAQRKESQQKRHSIFMPRRMTLEEGEQGEGGEEELEEGEEAGEEDNAREGTDSPEELDLPGPSTSTAARQSIVLERCPAPAMVQSQPAEYGHFSQAKEPPPHQPVLQMQAGTGPSSSSSFPFQTAVPAPLWNIPVQQHPLLGPLLQHSANANIPPSADASHLYTMVPPTVSIHSPFLLSPYATLQLPAGASLPSTSSDTTFLVNDLSPGNTEAQRQLVRAHLEQAQQQAQVAACQVQLLRDQLNSETTARLEAQSKTHQLLNSNRELLEQVQQLVNRLQVMESRMSEGLMNHLQANDVRHEKSPSRHRQSPKQRRASARPSEEAPSQELVGQLRPCQLKPLVRAGSLQGEEERRALAAAVAGDSAETDTDSGSGDQRSTGQAKPLPSSLLRRLVPSVPGSSSVLALGMPLLMGGQQLARNYNNVQAQAQPDQPRRKDSQPLVHGHLPPYRPPNDVVQHPSTSAGSSSAKKSLRRFSLQQAADFDPAELHHKQKSKPHISKGIFGKKEFKRMSFNTNPNKKSAEDKSLINVPEKEAESGGEAPMEWPGERRNSRSSPEKKLSGSPGEQGQRRRSSASLGTAANLARVPK